MSFSILFWWEIRRGCVVVSYYVLQTHVRKYGDLFFIFWYMKSFYFSFFEFLLPLAIFTFAQSQLPYSFFFFFFFYLAFYTCSFCTTFSFFLFFFGSKRNLEFLVRTVFEINLLFISSQILINVVIIYSVKGRWD